jgi:hypothetical protein
MQATTTAASVDSSLHRARMGAVGVKNYVRYPRIYIYDCGIYWNFDQSEINQKFAVGKTWATTV